MVAAALVEAVNGLQSNDEQQTVLKVYKRRWFMLILFAVYSGTNSMQWIQYSIIANIVTRYYGVSAVAIDWTSLIFMASYIPLIFPACFIIDKVGLRWTAIIGSIGTALGSLTKVFSAHQDGFAIAFCGQAIVAVSQLFTLSIPPSIAAVWFGAEQVSTACSIAVFGNLCGVAVGFFATPILVKNHKNLEYVGKDLESMYYLIAGVTISLAIITVVFFQAEPKLPPSMSQAEIRLGKNTSTVKKKTFYGSLKRLMSNLGFVNHFIGFGISIGTFNEVSTLLNQMVLTYFENAEEDAGKIGVIMVVTGMIGSVVFGIILDRTQLFKEVSLAIYALTTVGLIIFTIALESGSMWWLYLASGVLGTFMSGYIPVAFELGAELTYPEPEATSSGLLNASNQIFGIIFTLICGKIMHNYSPLWANIVSCVAMCIGTIITIFMPNKMKRKVANANRQLYTAATGDAKMIS